MPYFVGLVMEFLVSIRRINEFLMCDEIDENIIKREEDGEVAIEVNNGNFFWGFAKATDDEMENEKKKLSGTYVSSDSSEERPDVKFKDHITLKDINLNIKKGEFVCIVGEVGAGKSSMINSLVGNMIYVDNTVLEEYGEL